MDYETFKQSLTGEVVRPGEEGYDFGIHRWVITAVKAAQYVVFVKTNDDVAAAIKFARANDIEIAVCGGGHSWSGASSTTGLVIHLGKYMTQVRCDPEAKLMYVGGGALWETVDKVAAEHGLAAVAGAVNNTGVAGLALGGGYGWLTPRHGMVVDNFVKLTVVLASGEVVTASETENPDLFWGCRGGGSNFGVVTEFVFKAHPQRRTVFHTKLIFPMEKLEDVFAASEKWFETAGQDEAVIIFIGRQPPELKPGMLLLYFYNGTEEEGRKAGKVLFEAGPLMEIPSTEMPYVEMNTIQNTPTDTVTRRYIKGFTVPTFTSEVVKAIDASVEETVAAQPALAECGWVAEFIPKHAVLSHDISSTAFSARRTDRECLAFINYKDPTLDTLARDATRTWTSNIAHLTLQEGGGYVNYDPEPVKGADAMFGVNYERLREVKRKYDPDQVWRKWFPITPAEKED